MSSATPGVAGPSGAGRSPAANLPAAAALSLLFLLLASCAGEAPQIYQTYWRLEVAAEPDGGEQQERLTLFVQVDDADGYEDLALLTLSHGQEELSWQLSSETWSRVETSGEDWVGSGDLRPPRDGLLPRGTYRLRLEDRAGEQAKRSIYIDPQIRGLSRGSLPESRLPAPPAGEEKGLFFPFEQGHLLLLDGNERPIRAVPASELGSDGRRPAEDSLQTWRQEGARFFTLGSYSPEQGFGVERGPYPLERLGAPAKESPQE